MTNTIMRVLYENRFTCLKDLHPIAASGEECFHNEIEPMLHRAFPDYDDFEKVMDGIGELIASLQLGCYLDGFRDMISLLTFSGTIPDIIKERDGLKQEEPDTRIPSSREIQLMLEILGNRAAKNSL